MMTDTVQVGTNYIVKTPGNLGGRARIDGRRIGVSDIVDLHIRHGESLDEVMQAFEVTLAQLHAALAYYYDHPEEIDSYLDELDQYWKDRAPTQAEIEPERQRLLAKLKETNPKRYALITAQEEQSQLPKSANRKDSGA
jgi:uncharacterized protein (DUF433 family)